MKKRNKKLGKVIIHSIPNQGFIPDEIKEDQFVLGALGGEVLQLDGQWEKELPVLEIQKKGYLETSNCTAYGTTNALEILHKKKFGEETNHSDRYLGIRAGTRPPGNSPHTVSQAVRKGGLIPEEQLPFSDDLTEVEDYYSYKGSDQAKCEEEGQEWLRHWAFGHEWVLTGAETPAQKITLLKEGLKFSPIGLAVYAWAEKDGLYISIDRPNHWVCLYGYEEGKFWLIWDSYDSGIKKLAWDHAFGQAKRFSLDKKDPGSSLTWLQLIRQFFGKVV